jgi:hypothetical protein
MTRFIIRIAVPDDGVVCEQLKTEYGIELFFEYNPAGNPLFAEVHEEAIETYENLSAGDQQQVKQLIAGVFGVPAGGLEIVEWD